LLLFVLSLAWVWWPVGLPILWLVNNPTAESILALGFLYGAFIALVCRWGRLVHGEKAILRRYGLRWQGRNGWELLVGVGAAWGLLGVQFGLQIALGWMAWQGPQDNFLTIVVEGLGVGLAIGFAEELLFRGWLWDELARDYGPRGGMLLSALVFAIVHFLKPWSEIVRTFPQFPGLMLLGCALVLAKRQCHDRLGIAIGFHGGLVWGYYLLVVGNLLDDRAQVPAWITGVDGNPLAGLLGLFFLASLVTGLGLSLKQSPRKFPRESPSNLS